VSTISGEVFMNSNNFQRIHLPLAYRVYQNIMSRYISSNAPIPVIGRVFLEWSIRLAVLLLSVLKGLKFPRRAIGGWWWIWKYRFEILVGWYEYPVVQLIHSILQRGDVAIDIGAHIGYFSSLFSRLVGSSGKVIAFEPCPENFPVLVHNLSHKRSSNVHPVQVAVSDQTGHSLLYISPGHSNHSLIPGYTSNEGAVQVDSVTLDQYLIDAKIDHIDLIKIDAEGAEPKILKGMKGLISTNPHLALIMEINPKALEVGGSSVNDLLMIITDYHLIPRIILSDGRLSNIENRSIKETTTILCLKSTILP
jgi:FkbM family methyltransferase